MFPSDLRHFQRHEFDFPDDIDHDTLYFIDEVRERLGQPIVISSDLRPGEQGSTHPSGTALDFYPVPFDFDNRKRVIQIVLDMHDEGWMPKLGFEIASGHYHIDQAPGFRRPHIFVGISR